MKSLRASVVSRTSFKLSVAVMLLLGTLSGCKDGHDARSADDGKVRVVATIFPLADWAREVGGERVSVATLLPPGSSPHTFDPSPSDVRKAARAQIFLKVGLKMDDWGGRLANAAGGKVDILPLGDLLQADHLLPDPTTAMAGMAEIGGHTDETDSEHEHHDHDHGGINPHFWLDVELAIASVEHIRKALSSADPEGSATYTKNAASYIEKLRVLDSDSSASLAACTERSFVSFHNAYPYLAARYGLRIAAVIEEYPGKTPSDKYIKNLTDELRRLQIKTIFSEPQLNPQIAKILANEVQARVDVLDPYGTETAPDRNSYEKVVRYNVGKLRDAFCGAGTSAK